MTLFFDFRFFKRRKKEVLSKFGLYFLEFYLFFFICLSDKDCGFIIGLEFL